jgi:hypothetical protein
MVYSTLRILRPLALLAALAPVARGQVTVTASETTVLSDRTCLLTATHTDGRPRRWRWEVEEALGGSLRRPPSGPGMRYRAPVVLGPRVFHVRVSAEGLSARIALQVQPPALPEAMSLALDLLPEVHDPAWQVPRMTPFAGVVPGHPWGLGARFQHLAGVERVDWGDFGPSGGRWLAWDNQGLWAIQGPGRVRRLDLKGQYAPGTAVQANPSTFPRLRCQAVAAPPHSQDPGRAAVIALADPRPGHDASLLCHLFPDGTLRPFPLPAGFRFHGERILSMALDRRGNLHVLCTNAWIFRIAPDGSVFVWSDLFSCKSLYLPDSSRLGHYLPSPFLEPTLLTVDPRSGNVYLCDLQEADGVAVWIHRIAPDGSRHPIRIAPGPAKDASGALRFRLGALRFHRGMLYLSGWARRQVVALDLESRELVPLLESTLGGEDPRCGPLRIFAKDLSASTCAFAGRASHLAISGEELLLASGPPESAGLVRLDLPEDALRTTPRSTALRRERVEADPAEGSPTARPFTLEGPPPVLEAGSRSPMKAVPADGIQRRWTWTCHGMEIVPGPDGTATAVAPRVQERTLFTVLLEDPDEPGSCASRVVEVLPPDGDQPA